MSLRNSVHRKWDLENKERLKDIRWCELCGATALILDIAHRLKRRFIGYETEEDHKEYTTVAKLCRSCHTSLDEGQGDDPHGVMFDTITELIEKRPDDVHVA